MQPDFARNAEFHDHVAAEYDAHLLRNPYDVLAGRAFGELVTRYVSPGVLAYDNSPGMLSQLR